MPEKHDARIAELEQKCAELQATMDSTLDDLRRMQAVSALAGLPPKVYAGLAGKAKGDRIDRLERKCAELASMLRQVDEFLAGREIAAVGGTDYKAALHQLVTLETGILSRENVELAAVIKEVKDLYSDCPVCGKEEYAINGHLPGCALDVDPAAILAAHDAEVERRVLERVNSEDTEIIETLAIYRAQVEREVTANLIGEASLVGWTDGNPPLAGPDIAIEDAEAWLERDRERVRRETLERVKARLIASEMLDGSWPTWIAKLFEREFTPKGGSDGL